MSVFDLDYCRAGCGTPIGHQEDYCENYPNCVIKSESNSTSQPMSKANEKSVPACKHCGEELERNVNSVWLHHSSGAIYCPIVQTKAEPAAPSVEPAAQTRHCPKCGMVQPLITKSDLGLVQDVDGEWHYSSEPAAEGRMEHWQKFASAFPTRELAVNALIVALVDFEAARASGTEQDITVIAEAFAREVLDETSEGHGTACWPGLIPLERAFIKFAEKLKEKL